MAVSILYPSKEFCCGGVPQKHFQEVVLMAEQEVVPVPKREVLPVPDPELPSVAERDVLPVQEREAVPVQDAGMCAGQKLMRSG